MTGETVTPAAAPVWGRIADALGPRWGVAGPAVHRNTYDLAILHGQGDEALRMSRVEGYGSAAGPLPARVRIHGVYDRLIERGAAEARDHYHVENPSITVSLSKAPRVIARDIARRLLPGYRAALMATLENAARRQARARVTADLYGRLAAYQPQARRERYGGDRSYYLYPRLADHGHAKIELAEGEPPYITIEVMTHDAALAETIMRALTTTQGECAERSA